MHGLGQQEDDRRRDCMDARVSDIAAAASGGQEVRQGVNYAVGKRDRRECEKNEDRIAVSVSCQSVALL